MSGPAAAVARQARGGVRFPAPPAVVAFAAVGGRKEAEGPQGAFLDEAVPDPLAGGKTFEEAERRLLLRAADLALRKAGLVADDVDLFVAGDLLDQLITANFAARAVGAPFLGVFSACATSGGALLTASLAVAAGAARVALVATASHHLAAERQYRYPVELGHQRRPTQQWTATGGAAFVLRRPPAEEGADGLGVVAGTIGRVVDFGLKDVNDMGAAMAPAAADTIERHLAGRRLPASAYDLILTGDLGEVGTRLLHELLDRRGIDVSGRIEDAGLLLYDRRRQDVQAGGSGAACSALVLGGPVLRRLADGRLRRVLFVPTGSLHSVTSAQQGESIPAVAHAVEIARTRAAEDST